MRGCENIAQRIKVTRRKRHYDSDGQKEKAAGKRPVSAREWSGVACQSAPLLREKVQSNVAQDRAERETFRNE